MKLPPLSKTEAIRLECARITGDEARARLIYDFITEKPKAVKKPKKKTKATN